MQLFVHEAMFSKDHFFVNQRGEKKSIERKFCLKYIYVSSLIYKKLSFENDYTEDFNTFQFNEAMYLEEIINYNHAIFSKVKFLFIKINIYYVCEL